ncbi:hypothetical protein SAMN05216227_101057 [Pseudorhodobacter antarcticus]|uniref:Uncharacterized protein n=2 Tax=Pseudorhodobacter antarcticus TaxID=1077947 RepID=A0A1H8F9E4_9RHOB|nr:hypothetical protein SAMN05216227_101057 [Pseudorhodobacter antarcticus]
MVRAAVATVKTIKADTFFPLRRAMCGAGAQALRD